MRKAILTPEQDTAMEIARVALMNFCPFFADYFYSQIEEYPTHDIRQELGAPAATDGRRIYYDPAYMMTLTAAERVFVLAHEVDHTISRHPARMKHYGSEDSLRGLPWDVDLFNRAADYIVNAGLIELGIGMCNPAWLYDPAITSDELTEDVYEKLYKKRPPQPKGKGGEGGKEGLPSKTYGAVRRGGKPDLSAKGGSFDTVLPPKTDPVTGKADIPSDIEFKEAIAHAAAVAKALQAGKFPARFQRMVDEILDPQISWREHIRMLVTGKIGSRHETWERPNRRRLALSRGDATKMVLMPGRRGYGAKDIAVVVDTSGSINEKTLAAFFAELGGILNDVRPRTIHLIWCDAEVNRVDQCSSLDELAHIRVAGAPGGGGTSFIPPFVKIAEDDIRPECLVYLTDLLGPFPDAAPAYPVVWCATTNIDPPWGEVVRIKI